MQIKITAEQLEKAGACEEGVVEFRQLHGESLEREWTRETQIETLKGPLGKYVGWAFWNKFLPLWSMANADLQSANLRSANLQSANLESANLQSANLQSANLRSANLQSANLQSANLQSANLESANLRSADLRSADLRYADLRSADLRYANLAGAKICLCNSTPCASLRETLAAAGWIVGPDGLLSKAPAVTA